MFLPETVMTNHDLEKLTDTTDEWVVKRTGIRERHFAEEGVGASDLGIEAARQALDEAGLTGADLERVLQAYGRHLAVAYTGETRWADQPFWRRRAGRASLCP